MNESLPTAVTIRLPKGVDLEFRFIPAGEFRMGARDLDFAEEPVHLVRITKPFYLGKYPVTQGHYEVWRPDHENKFPGDVRRPVEQVTWDDAVAYCTWLSDRSQVTWPPGLDGWSAQLPSEAQWEYACRAGTVTEYHLGDGENALMSAGWYVGNSEFQTHPVGQKEPNSFGLYDMHGNVWEWCADAYEGNAYKLRIDGVADPKVTEKDDERDVLRVLRGGSWGFSEEYCRAAWRGRDSPAHRIGFQGFRVGLHPGQFRTNSPDSDAAQPVPADYPMPSRQFQYALPAVEILEDRNAFLANHRVAPDAAAADSR